MGLEITNKKWRQKLNSLGIIGYWTKPSLLNIDPLELLYSICKIIADENIHELKISSNLAYVINLTGSDGLDLPAKIIHSLKNLPKQIKKEINRHLQFVGGVHAEWLANEIRKDLRDITDILIALGYQEVKNNWFIPKIMDDELEINKNHALHHSLRKMFQYCGPLSVEDICGGLRHTASRTDYPTPPPEIMEEILKSLFDIGYTFEDGLYYYKGEMKEELSGGEQLIFLS